MLSRDSRDEDTVGITPRPMAPHDYPSGAVLGPPYMREANFSSRETL
jgi:hypothetical protein